MLIISFTMLCRSYMKRTIFTYTTLFRSLYYKRKRNDPITNPALMQTNVGDSINDFSFLYKRLKDEYSDEDLHNFLDRDRKSTRLNSSHVAISYAVFCLKKKNHVTKTSTK